MERAETPQVPQNKTLFFYRAPPYPYETSARLSQKVQDPRAES